MSCLLLESPALFFSHLVGDLHVYLEPSRHRENGQAPPHSSHCHALLFPPSIFLSIRVFSNESSPRIRWPKYWSFSFSISPSNEYWDCFPLGLTGLISLLSKGLSRIFSSTAVQKHQFFGAQPSLQTDSHPGLTVNDLGWGNKRARMTKISSLYMVYPL